MVSPLVTVTGATVATAVALRGTHRRTKSGGRGRGVSNRSDVAATATPRDSSEASTRRGRLTRTKATEGDGGDAADGDRRAFFAAATGLFSPHGAYPTRNTLKPARCTSRRPERASPGPSPSTFSGMPRHLVASTCSSRQNFFSVSLLHRSLADLDSPPVQPFPNSAQDRRRQRDQPPARPRVPPRRRRPAQRPRRQRERRAQSHLGQRSPRAGARRRRVRQGAPRAHERLRARGGDIEHRDGVQGPRDGAECDAHRASRRQRGVQQVAVTGGEEREGEVEAAPGPHRAGAQPALRGRGVRQVVRGDPERDRVIGFYCEITAGSSTSSRADPFFSPPLTVKAQNVYPEARDGSFTSVDYYPRRTTVSVPSLVRCTITRLDTTQTLRFISRYISYTKRSTNNLSSSWPPCGGGWRSFHL